MNRFSEEVRQAEFNSHNGYCRVDNCVQKIDDFHHRLPNTKANQRKFPLFIQSIFNCFGICRRHHEHYTMIPNLKITEAEAKVYEEYLERIKNV